jgi:hypothetical protein
MKQNTELTITAIGMLALLTIAVFVTINDIGKIL